MQLSDNALVVLEKRYFKKDEAGNTLEDWDALISRVAANVAGDDETKAARYKQLLDSGTFLPNSPTLMNAGRCLGQLASGFVLPV